MRDPKVICFFAEGLTIGDICTLFGGNTEAYDYVIDVDDSGVLILREPN